MNSIFKIIDPTELESTETLTFTTEPVGKGLTILADAITSETYGKIKYIIVIKGFKKQIVELQTATDEIPLVVIFKGDYSYDEILASLQLLIGHEGKYLAEGGYICSI